MESNRNLIKCLVPDLPTPKELLPFLERIHENRWYSNFGELSVAFESGIIKLLAETTSDNPNEIFCCTTSSGTSALEIAIANLNLKASSKILIPSLTFPASATAILRNGLTPLITDVCSETWQLTPELAMNLVEEYDFSAVIPVATFGVPVDSSGWDDFTKKTNIPVIIDAAGAFPFQKIPKLCTVIFSFHATKTFGIGEGGGIFVKNQLLDRKHKHLSNFGFKNGVIEEVGFNAKLSEFHSAVGLAQINRWNKTLIKRQSIYAEYDNKLKPNEHLIKQQLVPYGIPSLKVVECQEHANIMKNRLAVEGIETRQWYFPLLSAHPLFKNKATFTKSQYVSRHLSQHLLGIPFHNFLSDTDIDFVVSRLLSSNRNLKITKG
ncbi:MAG: DegT/DnrJ/EryC1/StrS family aminotransferase [Kangiellaceae bacterium]